MFGGDGIEPAGIFRLVALLGSTGLPIGGAGAGDRRLRDLKRGGEMAERACRIVEEAQRDPASMEFSFDARFAGFRIVFGGDLEGGFGVAGIEQLACQQTALGPPIIAADDDVGIVGNGVEDGGGFLELAGAAELLEAGELIGCVTAQRLRHGIHQLVGIGLVGDRIARLGQLHISGRAEGRDAHRGGELLLVEEAIGAEAMILFGEQLAELLLQGVLGPGADVVLAPDPRDEGRGFLYMFLGEQQSRLREAAGGGDGLVVREIAAHGGKVLVAVKCVLGACAQESL